jgi:hypothetical protein
MQVSINRASKRPDTQPDSFFFFNILSPAGNLYVVDQRLKTNSGEKKGDSDRAGSAAKAALLEGS